MNANERRKHPRIETALPLRFTIGNATYDTSLIDLSASGIRFRTPLELALMGRVQLALELPGNDDGAAVPITVTGVVVRSDPIEEGGRRVYDTAIFFQECSDTDSVKLDRFVSSRSG